jgi:hypothetical protein
MIEAGDVLTAYGKDKAIQAMVEPLNREPVLPSAD